jgi:sulfite reductase (NADPH) hemoprotein beta-component
MYKYDDYDQKIVDERVAQFRDQTRRYLAGELTDDEFRPLRLQNGLYIQRHAPMLRVAVPYGLLSTTQMRKLAHIARTYDKRLRPRQHAPEHPVQLARAEECARHPRRAGHGEMHAIQTSGNCIRNITTDPFAGVAGDESSIRARGAKCCASGAPSTRNSPSCRASSRSP